LIEGNGISCIVTGDLSYMSKVISRPLREHIKFVFMEQRVFHVHEKPISYEKVTLDTLVEDIEELRKHLGLNKIAVLGHSMMGLFALEYAKMYPENVTHIIMLNTPPQLEYWASIKDYWKANAPKERWNAYNERKTYLEKNKDKLSPEKLSLLSMTMDEPLRWYDSSFDSSFLHEGYRMNREGYHHISNQLITSFDIRDKTPVNIPVFMSQSIHDFIVPISLWDDYDFSSLFTDFTLHIFEKSCHTPQLEEQELFDKLLIEWLRTH
jgi:proline iminopeptidase